MNGVQQQSKFDPDPGGSGDGSKSQISLNFNNKKISKIFIPNFFVFLQIKDINISN